LELLAGLGGLLKGLFLLATHPLLGVLVAVTCMALLLRPAASFCGAQTVPREVDAASDATD